MSTPSPRHTFAAGTLHISHPAAPYRITGRVEAQNSDWTPFLDFDGLDLVALRVADLLSIYILEAVDFLCRKEFIVALVKSQVESAALLDPGAATPSNVHYFIRIFVILADAPGYPTIFRGLEPLALRNRFDALKAVLERLDTSRDAWNGVLPLSIRAHTRSQYTSLFNSLLYGAEDGSGRYQGDTTLSQIFQQLASPVIDHDGLDYFGRARVDEIIERLVDSASSQDAKRNVIPGLRSVLYPYQSQHHYVPVCLRRLNTPPKRT